MTDDRSGSGSRPRIDLNAATADELETLPGIGPAYAAAIVLAREQDGPFKSPDALVGRGIIPERVLEGIRSSVETERTRVVSRPTASIAGTAGAVRGHGAGVRRRAVGLSRALRSRRARIGLAVAVCVLAVAAYPIYSFVNSFTEGARAYQPEGIVADATSPTASSTADPTGTASATDSQDVTTTPVPTAVPVPDSPVRYIGNTDGDGVGLRTACEDKARTDGAWAEGTEVVIEERGAGACFSWSLVSRGDTTSWVRNIYLVEQSNPVAIVTGVSASLPNAGISRAQEYCIHYSLGGALYKVCRTFPTVERSLWTPWDLGTFGHLSYDRLRYFADCYVNNPRVGAPLDRCAFTPLDP